MKKITTKIKIQIKACEANPSPPIGPTLGAKGVNIIKFCNEFNLKTKNTPGLTKGILVPVIIDVYQDKTFNFKIKSPPTSTLIKNVLNIKKGSDCPNKKKIGTITKKQLEMVIKQKYNDLITNSHQATLNTLLGTAKSMGLNMSDTQNEENKTT